MNTPIADFIRNYMEEDMSRFHMPGHKGKSFLGFEAQDITEIHGAGNLYEYDGIIAESEKNAAGLFGSRRTFYSAGGSSQSIRAMLYLAVCNYKHGRPVIVAARNVHKAFIYAAAMLDFDVQWVYPAGDMRSLCSCSITAEGLDSTLKSMDKPAAAVYITSPDYLGGQAGIAALAKVCHENGTILLVDNAHGAYLRFLEPSQHPMDLGADMCCDSAHKTLPVLTGGAYLHISQNASCEFDKSAKSAMEMFGSTSPSYLIMTSLDMCNKYLEEGYRERLADTVKRCESVKAALKENGWQTERTDPLRITICTPHDVTGEMLGNKLREHRVECEFADADYVVLMVTPENSEQDMYRIIEALGVNTLPYYVKKPLNRVSGDSKMTIRQALMSGSETVPIEKAHGRICASAGVGCPPAIPVAVPGEIIGESAVEMLEYYGIKTIAVVKQNI